MSADRSAELVASPRCAVGEAPLYDASTDTLYWVDIPAGDLWRWSDSDGAQSWSVGEPLGSIALIDGGGWLLATRTGILVAAAWAAPPALWHTLEPDLPTQCNDGKCDPGGRFIVGTADPGRAELGALYRVGTAAAPERLVSDLKMSNGLDWSPDGSRFHHADSLTGTVFVDAWDLDAGQPHNRRPFVTVERGEGLPDGLCVDVEGCVWLAVWGAGEVRRYSPDGRQIGGIGLPTPNVTSCAFGGTDYSKLFITTAVAGLQGTDLGNAGDVFVVETSTYGAPPRPFRRSQVPSSLLTRR